MSAGNTDALRAFHAFFADRCEGLFAQFGMPAVDAYNAAARQVLASTPEVPDSSATGVVCSYETDGPLQYFQSAAEIPKGSRIYFSTPPAASGSAEPVGEIPPHIQQAGVAAARACSGTTISYGAICAAYRAMAALYAGAPPSQQAELPRPGSPTASAMIDSLLAEYQYPSNSKNAARAGYEAARRLLRDPASVSAKDAEPVGDMFWNYDDAETPYSSIDEFLNAEICQGSMMEVGAEFTILRAAKLPRIKIRVTSIDDESCEAEYEVITPAASKGAA